MHRRTNTGVNTKEVFLRAFRNLGRLRDPKRFAAWLLGMTRMTCREWRRKAARERRHRGPLEADPVAPQAGGIDGAAAEQLMAGIRALPEKERLAMHLYYLQENSAEAAQRIMKLSRSGFYRVLDGARARLRRIMEG